jgi:4-hydroxy-2-oxoheptanedioate aldolase
VPLIRSVAEVKSVVASAKFPPQGNRGFGSPIAMQNFSPAPTFSEYLQQANEGLLTMVQIETQEALDAVEEIASLVDVVFIGPFDLGNNIGHPIINGKMDPQLNSAIEKILAAAQKTGTKSGIYCSTAQQAKHYADMGFDMISVATDYSSLQEVMAESLAIARGQIQPVKGRSY